MIDNAPKSYFPSLQNKSADKKKCPKLSRKKEVFFFYTSPKVLKPASVLESVRELLNTDYQGFQPEISNFNWSGMDPGIDIFTGASDREDC